MSRDHPDEDDDRPHPEGLDEAIRRFQRKWDRRDQEDYSLADQLAWAGAIGWLVVVPTLIGIYVGRLLDAATGMGVFWTASLTLFGVGLGAYLAWQRIQGDSRTSSDDEER